MGSTRSNGPLGEKKGIRGFKKGIEPFEPALFLEMLFLGIQKPS
jgi:hypothetical protein